MNAPDTQTPPPQTAGVAAPLAPNPERPDDLAKPFIEHLEELRLVIIKSAGALTLAMIGAFIFRRDVLELFYWPLRSIGEDPGKFLKVLGVADPFTLALQVAFFAGIIVALPFILWFIASFILPALTAAERRLVWPVLASGTTLFICGIAFCYFLVLPPSLKFFLDFSAEMGFTSEWTVQNYISFCTQMLLSFGIAFELPMVILSLAKLGLVDSGTLQEYRRHAVLIIVFASAVITPTSDVLTLLLMAGPMWFLYEMCIWICLWLERMERKAQARRGY